MHHPVPRQPRLTASLLLALSAACTLDRCRAAAARPRIPALTSVATSPSRLGPRRHAVSAVTTTAAPAYSAQDITVLEGLDPVRKRPGMYIGSTGPQGLHHLVFEIVDNSVDEALQGQCAVVRATLLPDGSVCIEDDGRGIPCDMHRQTGKSTLETVLTVLHAGGKFGDGAYAVSGGLHGVGMSVVNALAERLRVQVRRDGREYTMEFSRGAVVSPMRVRDLALDAAAPHPGGGDDLGASAEVAGKVAEDSWDGGEGLAARGAAGSSAAWRAQRTGTRVRFKPDPVIFAETTVFDAAVLARRFDQLAYLNAGLVIELVDLRTVEQADAGGALGGESAPLVAEEGADGADDAGPGVEADAKGEEAGFEAGPFGGYSDGEDEVARGVTPEAAAAAGGGGGEGEDTPPASTAGVRMWRFQHRGGIREMVRDLCRGGPDELLAPEPILVCGRAGPDDARGRSSGAGGDGGVAVQVEVALQWSQQSYREHLLSFANGIQTPSGGSHVDGFKASLTKVINSSVRRLHAAAESAALAAGKGGRRVGPKAARAGKSPSSLAGDNVRDGLTAVVSVKLENPEFEGQTKSKLGSSHVRGIVDRLVAEQLTEYFHFHEHVLLAVIDKAQRAADAALAARSARDLVRKRSALGGRTVLPGKLSDCQLDDPASCELFIVEGDSAGGSAKQGRDRRTQAILPLRGKILNIEKVEEKRIYENAEVQALVTSLGLGARGEPVTARSLRYHKVVLMTDADVDGAHIRTLLLTFFYRYAPDLILGGHVFIACPPLLKVVVGQTSHYCATAEEANALLAKHPRATVQRFKGLGEMMAGELWATTMDPGQRTLKRVDIIDAQQAEEVFATLMGENVQSRKEFIEAHAQHMDEDDIDV